MSNRIRRKLLFQGKVLFTEADAVVKIPSPKATPDLHLTAETSSERNEVKQKDAASGQPSAQESSAEETPVDGSELESDYSSASNETH